MNDLNATAHSIAEKLAASSLFLNYRDAFRQATGLRVSLEPHSREWRDFRVPSIARMRLEVKAGSHLVAWLSLQPVVVTSGEYRTFDDVARKMLDDGEGAAEVRAAQELYVKLPIVDSSHYGALETLLKIYVQQLSEAAERVFLQATESEPQGITKARDYIGRHLTEVMSLEEVAHHAGISAYHFCKVFKKCTGCTFTEYVNRARVEQAKHLLMKPGSRVTEVAYDVGFQSLSQFNRSFRRMTSESPSSYRSRIHRTEPNLAAA